MSARTVVFFVMTVAACGGRNDITIALRYHPPTGAVYHHTIEQHTRVSSPSGSRAFPGLAHQEVALRLNSTQRVKGPAAGGGIEVVIVADSASMTMPGMSPESRARAEQQVRGMRNTLVFDDRSHVVRTESQSQPASGAVSQMAYMLRGPEYAFPDQAVARGDSWTVTTDLPIGQFAGVTTSRIDPAQTTLTVREIRVRDADTSVVIDIKTAFPTGPIRLEIAGLQASMRLSGDMGGYQEFSVTRGTVVDALIKGVITIKVTVTALGMQDLAVRSETESSIRLTGAGAPPP